jgi:hypothetical protein
MSVALWANVDRVVCGATIEDANRHCRQIEIAATELANRRYVLPNGWTNLAGKVLFSFYSPQYAASFSHLVKV